MLKAAWTVNTGSVLNETKMEPERLPQSQVIKDTYLFLQLKMHSRFSVHLSWFFTSTSTVQKEWKRKAIGINKLFIRGVNRMVRHDSISILIPSNTIFADTSKNYMIRFDLIQEYIDRYIDMFINFICKQCPYIGRNSMCFLVIELDMYVRVVYGQTHIFH